MSAVGMMTLVVKTNPARTFIRFRAPYDTQIWNAALA